MLYRVLGSLVRPFRVCGFYVYNFLFHTERARVLMWNEDEELLLVRNWGGERHWSLPGGGVKRGERPVGAARREVFEETGLLVPVNEFAYIATVRHHYDAPIYSVLVQKDALPPRPHNPREITDLRWFSLDALPVDLSPLVKLALNKLSKVD